MSSRWFSRTPGQAASPRRRLAVLARVARLRPAEADPFGGTEQPGELFEAAWRSNVRRRVVVVVSALAVWVVAVQVQLVNLQVRRHDELTEMARQRQQERITTEPLRGDIVDRRGAILGYSVEAHSIVGVPRNVKDASATAQALCKALGDCSARDRSDMVTRLSGTGQFTILRRARTLSPEQTTRVEALRLRGIQLKAETRRYYPQGELGAHVIGYVGADNAGQAGIEQSQNAVVGGVGGVAHAMVDARRDRLETWVDVEARPGATLELSLDLRLQHIAERELRAGIERNKAKGGSVVIMDPQTGEILALASYPTFNPNAVGQYSADERRNRALQDVYEPGSTFKIITAAAAIEEGILRPEDLIDCAPGVISLPGRPPIREASNHNYGVLSFEDVIVKSSNVGAIKAGFLIGSERLNRYVQGFGFGQVSAAEFVGESRGLWSPPSDQSGLASISMGYQISVTPLQMAAAASVVANGGFLVRPHAIRAVIRDGRREEVTVDPVRRVISTATAATLTSIMEAVTERGTAKGARVKGYQVAGKTGTAHKVVDRRYSSSDYNASFVGFVPSRRPAFTILVVIDTPRAGSHYGGTVAAPVFQAIAEAALRTQGVPPSLDPAPAILVDGSVPSLPARPRRAAALPVSESTEAGAPQLMPDLRGMSAREAVRILGNLGLLVRMGGSGVVQTQTPTAGLPVESGTWSSLVLGRDAIDPRVAGGGR